MVSSENPSRIGIGGYLWYLMTTVAVFLLSIPLVVLLAAAGIVKLLYPPLRKHR